MKKNDTETRLNDYLESTIRWKDTLKDLEIPVLASGEILMKTLQVSPWSLLQLDISTGVEMNDLSNFIKTRKGLRIIEKGVEKRTVKVLETKEDINFGSNKSLLADMANHNDVHGLIRILVWISARRSSKKTGDFPTLSDSILTVKNEMMIPDDFMPAYMMNLVESGVETLTDGLISAILDRDNLLFLICGFDSEGNAYPVSIIPSMSYSCDSENELYTKITGRLKEVFAEMSSSKEFESLTIGRTIRALIYQLEKNKKRDLSGFIWRGEKIKILRSLDLVDDLEGKPFLKQSVDSIELGHIYADYRSKTEELSSKWLSTKISM